MIAALRNGQPERPTLNGEPWPLRATDRHGEDLSRLHDDQLAS
jgi:hypothetical protein